MKRSSGRQLTETFVQLAALAVFYMASSSSAYAYIDPVTGSLLIQGAVAAIAGIVAGVKAIRLRIVRFLSCIFRGQDDSQ